MVMEWIDGTDAWRLWSRGDSGIDAQMNQGPAHAAAYSAGYFSGRLLKWMLCQLRIED